MIVTQLVYKCACCTAMAYNGRKPASSTCSKRPDGRHVWTLISG